MQLMGRALGDPSGNVRRIFKDRFREVIQRFVQAFGKALPGHSREELFWRLSFTAGAMAHTMAMGDHLEDLSDGACRKESPEETIRRLVDFVSAGMTARARSGEAGEVA